MGILFNIKTVRSTYLLSS